MKNIRDIGLILLLCFSFLSVSSPSPGPEDWDSKNHSFLPLNSPRALEGVPCSLSETGNELAANRQILVKFKPTMRFVKQRMLLDLYGIESLKFFPQLRIHHLEVPEDVTAEEMAYVLNLNPDVEFAEPDRRANISITPNDPLFNLQYALHNSGQAIGTIPGSPQGKVSADISAPQAWEETMGSEDVVIGIIDTGLDRDHPDLVNKAVSSGKDFVNDDDNAFDDQGHGTHVASIIAAETDNNIGMAGVAWDCKVLAAKAMDEEGYGWYSAIIEAIIWLADQGVDVINMSIGADVPSQALENALKYAHDKDIVLVASSGNDAANVLYPAAYDDYVLAVSATDYNDEWAPWSNFGPEIDVAAPGERILGAVPVWYPALVWDDITQEPYAYGYGTSAAAPHVAGVAALIRSVKPDLSADEIMNIIRYSADDLNSSLYPGKDQYIGYGRLNAKTALVPLIIIQNEK